MSRERVLRAAAAVIRMSARRRCCGLDPLRAIISMTSECETDLKRRSDTRDGDAQHGRKLGTAGRLAANRGAKTKAMRPPQHCHRSLSWSVNLSTCEPCMDCRWCRMVNDGDECVTGARPPSRPSRATRSVGPAAQQQKERRLRIGCCFLFFFFLLHAATSRSAGRCRSPSGAAGLHSGRDDWRRSGRLGSRLADRAMPGVVMHRRRRRRRCVATLLALVLVALSAQMAAARMYFKDFRDGQRAEHSGAVESEWSVPFRSARSVSHTAACCWPCLSPRSVALVHGRLGPSVASRARTPGLSVTDQRWHDARAAKRQSDRGRVVHKQDSDEAEIRRGAETRTGRVQ